MIDLLELGLRSGLIPTLSDLLIFSVIFIACSFKA
jgi:hypothetical protein